MLWDIEWIKGISEILEKLLVNPKICHGFSMHITELYLEELSKVGVLIKILFKGLISNKFDLLHISIRERRRYLDLKNI